MLISIKKRSNVVIFVKLYSSLFCKIVFSETDSKKYRYIVVRIYINNKIMLTEKLNNELINSMKAKVPNGTNLASLLMEILFIGKEAVYRRLRGEVPFTLSEAALISRKLGISIAQLMGKSFNGNALFALNIINHAEPYQSYHSLLSGWNSALMKIADDKYSEMSESSNLLPNFFFDEIFRHYQVSSFQMDVSTGSYKLY